MRKYLSASVTVLLALALGACASSSPDLIERGDAQRMSQIQDGTVLTVRPVVVDGSQSGVGATVGGVVGAIGGYSGSGVSREAQVLGVLAGVAGAAAGNAIERMSTKEEALEILVQLKSGDRRPAAGFRLDTGAAAVDHRRTVAELEPLGLCRRQPPGQRRDLVQCLPAGQ